MSVCGLKSFRASSVGSESLCSSCRPKVNKQPVEIESDKCEGETKSVLWETPPCWKELKKQFTLSFDQMRGHQKSKGHWWTLSQATGVPLGISSICWKRLASISMQNRQIRVHLGTNSIYDPAPECSILFKSTCLHGEEGSGHVEHMPQKAMSAGCSRPRIAELRHLISKKVQRAKQTKRGKQGSCQPPVSEPTEQILHFTLFFSSSLVWFTSVCQTPGWDHPNQHQSHNMHLINESFRNTFWF